MPIALIFELFFLQKYDSDCNNLHITNRCLICIVMQEASGAHGKTADSDTVSTYQVSSVQLVTDEKLEAFNKA